LQQVIDVFVVLRQIFRSIAMSKAVTIKTCKMMVKPAVVHGGETKPVTEMDIKVWVHGRGKRIHGPVIEEGI
jgi:hypothetical protein